MNNKVLSLCITLLVCTTVVKSQCNQQLVDFAAEKAGTDAIYIRDFKVRLSKGTMDTPSPTGKFPIYLNEGVSYRFTIENAREYSGNAYVELERRGQTYANNYSFEGGTIMESFDFECKRSATYQLLINFGDNKEGCAAVVMSLIMKDTIIFIEPDIPFVSDSAETMYLWVKNELQVASSEDRYAEFKIDVSQGSVQKQGRFYIIEPAHTGNLMVKVDVFKNNKLIESDSLDYEVILPPLPNLGFKGIYTHQIASRDLYRIKEVILNYPVEMDSSIYRLEKFALTESVSSFNRYVSYSGNLTIEQQTFLAKLKPGQSFFLADIIFTDPDGQKHYPAPIRFNVVE